MSTNEGNTVEGRGKSKQQDPAWEHGKSLLGNPFGSECNYCRHVMKSGGITRLKEHLAWMSSNVKNCPKVPKEVRDQMREILISRANARRDRKKKDKSIAEELGGSYVDLDENEDEEEEIQQLRHGLHESRAEQWAREEAERLERQRPTFHESIRETGGGSSRKKKENIFSRSFSTKRATTKLYGEVGGTQRKIAHMYRKGKDSVKTLGSSIARFFIYGAVPAHLVESIPFKNMIATAQREGVGVPCPSSYQIFEGYLNEEFEEIQKWMKDQHYTWETYGLSIMCDGWTGPTKLSIINFMLYCRGTSVFLTSIDASQFVKNADYIEREIEKQIENLGNKFHIVQIITDNASAFKKAGKALEKKYPLYWTPCAAHCIDLILEDIGRRESVKETIGDARKITKYIYNHTWVKAMFHEQSGYRNEIVRPGKTRFATNYIALDSLWSAKKALNTAFNSNEWQGS